MKRNLIIYWIATGILSLMMAFSAFSYLSNPKFAAFFVHLGFPGYFRIELAVAKFIGVVVLLVPGFSLRIKEWAYAGFGVVFLSASFAHFSSGDSVEMVITPLIFFLILAVSNISLYKSMQVRNPESGTGS